MRTRADVFEDEIMGWLNELALVGFKIVRKPGQATARIGIDGWGRYGYEGWRIWTVTFKASGWKVTDSRGWPTVYKHRSSEEVRGCLTRLWMGIPKARNLLS